MFVLYLWEMKIDTITLYEKDLQDAGAWFVGWDWIGKLCVTLKKKKKKNTASTNRMTKLKTKS